MRCAKCGADNREGRKFCTQCGSPLAAKCPRCGAATEPDEKFCGECGVNLGTSPPPAAKQFSSAAIRVTAIPTTENLDGERKTVTALFADIKGSTELMEDLDPEEARAIVDPALKLMIDAIRRYDGYVVQSTGDGIFALFGAPVAHEDHPQRALYAAVRIQDELRRYSTRLVANGGIPIQCRVGANTGEVVVRTISTREGHTEYAPIGHTTNLASRMQAVAPVGSIAVSGATRRLCEGYFNFKALGPTRVKGVSEPVEVSEVIGLGPLRTPLQRAVGRGLTKFVGREREMDALKHALEQAKAGRGQIVAAMAEAGVGKSRLFYEFKATSQTGCRVLEAFSVSHGKASAYFPVIDLLQGYFGIRGEDDPRTRREKVTGRVVALDRSLEDTLPYIFCLIGIVEGEDLLAQMDGEVKKRRTLEAIKRILLCESLNQPLMVIFEDLHWIDEQTQDFLNLLTDSIGTAKILLLVNYRPEYSHQWGSKTYYTQLRLDPLGQETALEMLSALLADDEDLAPLKRLIIQRTEGTPFFMEEMVQALFEDGVLERNGAVKLAKPMSEVKVPTTVEAVLASRIDRLPSAEKELLQTLAVLGREFPLGLVQRVALRADEELEQMLSRLQVSEFIYEQPAARDVEYVFKHALTQEVAYNSLLLERRKVLHERIGAALEMLHSASLEDHLAELAHHYGRSNNHDKAADYIGRAAQQAVSRSAFNEALVNARTGVALVSAMPASSDRDRREFALLSTLVRAATAIEGYGSAQTAHAFPRMLELARESGDDSELFTALLVTCSAYTVRARHREGAEMAVEMLEVAARTKNPTDLADAHTGKGLMLSHTGHAGESLIQFNRAIELASNGAPGSCVEGVDHLVWPLSGTARSHWVAGYPDRAVDLIKSAIERSRGLNQPLSLAFATFFQTSILSLRGEVLATQQACKQFEALLEERGFRSFVLANRVHQGWVLSRLGQNEQGITLIRSGIAVRKNPLGLTHDSSILAEACVRAGRHQEAMDAIVIGREHALRTGEGFAKSEIERIAGDVLILMGAENIAEAEQCMRRAIAIAAEQEAKSWELRGTISLARLLATHGKPDEARTILAEVYNWFTEGFDTADLKEAKALLEELSR